MSLGLIGWTWAERGQDGDSNSIFKSGTYIETISGRHGTIIDSREQDNIINTEIYYTVRFADGEQKELHWSRIRKIKNSSLPIKGD